MKTKMETVSYVSCLFPSLGIRFQRKKTQQIETKLKINNNKLSKSFLMEVTLNELKCWFHDAKAEIATAMSALNSNSFRLMST